MNIPDLTTQQDEAFTTLRRFHNRDNPNNQLTKAQMIDAYALKAFNSAIDEAERRMNTIELQRGYKAASPSVQAQVNTLLGL